MMSCAPHYDIIYHPSLISSQYLNTSGVDSPAKGCSARMGGFPFTELPECLKEATLHAMLIRSYKVQETAAWDGN